MKKIMLVAVFAAMLLFVFAGSAFAANYSGQTGFGAQGSADSSDTAISTANIYLSWDITLGGNAQQNPALIGFAGNSPHGNYTTTTVKCVVCHAVHYAAPGTAPLLDAYGDPSLDGFQTADTLLRMRADQSCGFCHATAGMSVNGRPVYNGQYPFAASDTGAATNMGHATGDNCSLCHTTVHGVNQDNSVAALAGYLLKKQPQTSMGAGNVATANMFDAILAIDLQAQNEGFAAGAALGATPGQYQSTSNATLREQAVGIFCAECHNGAYATVAPGATTNIAGSSATVAYSGHRIAAAANPNWNLGKSVSSSAMVSGQTAWAPATNCKSCHDAQDNWGNDAFPHAWGDYDPASTATIAASGTKMWLMSAAEFGVNNKTKLPAGAAPNSGFNTGKPQLYDGVCLKCHVAPGGTAGVGITF